MRIVAFLGNQSDRTVRFTTLYPDRRGFSYVSDHISSLFLKPGVLSDEIREIDNLYLAGSCINGKFSSFQVNFSRNVYCDDPLLFDHKSFIIISPLL